MGTHAVDVYTGAQLPGQHVIIKPGVIHWGYNAGANTAEAVNFALPNHRSVSPADAATKSISSMS